jgi:hypothetical protein
MAEQDPRGERPRLRLVGDNSGSGSHIFDDLEKARYVPRPEVEAAELKLQRRPGWYFAQVELAWLTDPERRSDFSPEIRLYLYLQIKSRRGLHPVRLTNLMLADIGIHAHNKTRYVRRLEARGLVKVVSSGNRNPEIILLR